MMSAYADVELAVTSMRLGAFDFFEKPFDPTHLLNRIQTVIAAATDAETLCQEARQHAALMNLLTERGKNRCCR